MASWRKNLADRRLAKWGFSPLQWGYYERLFLNGIYHINITFPVFLVFFEILSAKISMPICQLKRCRMNLILHPSSNHNWQWKFAQS
jgi:hypothetical protein